MTMEELHTERTEVGTEVETQSSTDVHMASDTELSNAEETSEVVVPENSHEVTSNCEVPKVEVPTTQTCETEDACPMGTDSCSVAVKVDDVVDVASVKDEDSTTVCEEKDNNNQNDSIETNEAANDSYTLELEQSGQSLIESNVEKINEDVQTMTKNVINTERETSVSAEVSVQDNQLEDSESKKAVDKTQPEGEIHTEICENNDPSSSLVTDTELTNLVDESSEVVLEIVETEPIPCESSEENTLVTKGEKDGETCNENVTNSTNEKVDEKSEVETEELDIIDYSQESDGTIIEVISTEVVQSDEVETPIEHKTKENKEDVQSDEQSTKAVVDITASKENVINNDIHQASEAKKEIVIKETEQNEEEEENDDMGVKNELLHDHQQIVAQDHETSPKVKKDHINTVIEEAESSDRVNAMESPVKKRSVIQDIFDDWGVENPEDDGQSPTKVQDSVEIELKSLLDDNKGSQKVTEETIIVVEETLCCIDGDEPIPESMQHSTKVLEELPGRKIFKALTDQTDSQNKNKLPRENVVTPVNKDHLSPSLSHSLGKSSRNNAQESVGYNQTPQSHISVPRSRNRHLTSQIASPAEVTKVLKERLREKQKMVETPRGPDIFFVKKITQRLSSKLAGGPVSPIPALIPLPHPQPSTESSEKKSPENNVVEPAKDNSADNKELLAILEGDVDPDWSNLKPPTLTEEARTPTTVDHNEHSTPPKLDPLVERELALKQLLELPSTPMKKSVPKKKKTFKPAPNKSMKDANKKLSPSKEVKKDSPVKIDLVDEPAESVSKIESPIKDPPATPIPEVEKEKVLTPIMPDVRSDESRSGRKRKPTEKAREHEQNTSKRQKVYKGKITQAKKPRLETENNQSVSNTSLTVEQVPVPQDTPQKEVADAETKITEAKEAKEVKDVKDAKDAKDAKDTKDAKDAKDTKDAKDATPVQIPNKVHTTESKAENSPLKRPKQSLTKKGSQPIAKRKMVVKKLLRQKMSKKLNASPKKSSSKIVAKSQQKRSSESSSGDVKPKKKIINEIDRLLQDEGVVNLLYDVEQPDKKRLVPITKSQAKVMDIQKVQRELNIRKKLVRNAVLRLRTSTGGVTKVSPRSTRTTIHVDSQIEKKSTDQSKSPKAVSSAEFIFPAKIRNAADASIIIRRHSSSSFSSASGSPRVSVDGPEKQYADASKLEDGSHSLRSTKRRHSQDERMGSKKTKKKPLAKVDVEATEVIKIDEKGAIMVRANKKSEPKKAEKSSKPAEAVLTDESSGSSGSKVVTRSNGTTTGKMTAKNKKAVKTKLITPKMSESDNNEESSKEEDELSACLAEAATALSIVSATSRSGNGAINRKNKVSPSVAKTVDADNIKTKTEAQNQFSNKEINVRRHGYLVQLILTPSTPSKIKNALTLQVMQEFREALSILKKDDECRVVLFTSTGTSFCEGLELSSLMQGSKDERRQLAQELADSVKDFIKTLASFNKPIVAGVQGTAVGLGVTMLPLFDLVIASDKATFSTPYGKLGQIAEGAAVFTLSHILGTAITSELLLGGRTLTASEALRAGLVTRVLWPDRFQVDLLPSLRAMSEQSAQSMEATKALLRHSLRKKLDACLESETYLLIQHWCSTECQTAMKAYMDGKVQ